MVWNYNHRIDHIPQPGRGDIGEFPNVIPECAALLPGLLPDVAEKVVQQGFDPAVSSPDEFGKRIKIEIARFGKAVKESGARVD